ncbi:MAG TPA: carbon monoxide dehydrogenase subunit G [Usitatibacter sp.]|jgi:carbon monoxide dehydrogenase subunit G|nr:carbon monoxide dehydrogenase subunit G [Usitatibacter sp.]
MEMTGERRLPVGRQAAWDALNDPEMIRKSMPGCESMERTPEGYALVMRASLGPVNAKFKGKLWLEDVVQPERYTLRFSGDGVAAGFASGAAHVKLTDDGDGTLMAYEVKAQVGGKLAQLGSRLVDSAARKMADAFFAEFEKAVAASLL